jgi:hypothetical protein
MEEATLSFVTSLHQFFSWLFGTCNVFDKEMLLNNNKKKWFVSKIILQEPV